MHALPHVASYFKNISYIVRNLNCFLVLASIASQEGPCSL